MSPPLSASQQRKMQGGAYQCCKCGKTVNDTALVELRVLVYHRTTLVWICLEHAAGVEALSCEAIQQHLQTSELHRQAAEKRRLQNSAVIHASRFKDATPAAPVHDFVADNTPAGKRMEPVSGNFVNTLTLSAKLGIHKDAVAMLVKDMNIVVFQNNGQNVIKKDDFDELSAEIRRRVAKKKRDLENGGSGAVGINRKEPAIVDNTVVQEDDAGLLGD